MVITSLGETERGSLDHVEPSDRTTDPEPEMNSPCLNLLFTETVNHLVAQVIYCLHLSGLKCQLAHFGALKEVKLVERFESILYFTR